MNEIVKYSNELHRINFSALSEAQQNILFTLLYEIKHQNTDFLELDIIKISELADINTRNKDYFIELLNGLTHFQELKFRYEINEQGDLRQEVIFPIIETQLKNNKIFVKVSSGFRERFLLVNNEFTRYELAEFVSLSSKYTKTIYRYLKQFRNTGLWKIKYKDFKEILGIPSSYQTCNIETRIIKPAIKQLTQEKNLFDEKRIPFKNLKIKKIKGRGRGRGGIIEALEFTFDKENTDNKKIKAEKKKIADQNSEIQATEHIEPNLDLYLNKLISTEFGNARITNVEKHNTKLKVTYKLTKNSEIKSELFNSIAELEREIEHATEKNQTASDEAFKNLVKKVKINK